ncbi:uncharacterized protein LOC135387941 [Ornithodoros turicata]|uniref:uncharacterized protein LOC135387941 n=1 Tax=Ornithodoros turicata TaxID=34597 RepID=UPI0031398171
MRRPIPSADRLTITLRYLATGESQHSLSRQFRVGHSTVNGILFDTCQAIYDEMQKEFLQIPRTEEEWLCVIDRFNTIWQFPGCIGALDGKHVAITKPAKSGSLYFNYKKFFSIVLFALADAQYKFLYIDVGAEGSSSDGGIWMTTPLASAIRQEKAHLPAGVPLPGQRELHMPAVIIADDAFPLGEHLMKPYGGSNLSDDKCIFNYRYTIPVQMAEFV